MSLNQKFWMDYLILIKGRGRGKSKENAASVDILIKNSTNIRRTIFFILFS